MTTEAAPKVDVWHRPAPTEGPRLLVVESDRKHLKTLARTLRAVVGTVEEAVDLPAVPEDGDYDLIVAAYEALGPEQRRQLLARYGGNRGARTKLLLFSEGTPRGEMVEFFKSHSLTNVVAKSDSSVDTEELIVTTRKILTQEIFGIEKYFIWGIEPVAIRISSSTEKANAIALGQDFAESIGINPRFVTQLCSVADELITNALYNAPVDDRGEHRFAHYPRSERVALEPSEVVEVKFCCDGRRLGVSTSDPFGSLTVERILDYLSKCMRRGNDQVDQKAGGAGLGLFYIFDAVSNFVVNLSPGKRTEIVGLFDVRGSYREFAARPKSFNVFVSRGS